MAYDDNSSSAATAAMTEPDVPKGGATGTATYQGQTTQLTATGGAAPAPAAYGSAVHGNSTISIPQDIGRYQGHKQIDTDLGMTQELADAERSGDPKRTLAARKAVAESGSFDNSGSLDQAHMPFMAKLKSPAERGIQPTSTASSAGPSAPAAAAKPEGTSFAMVGGKRTPLSAKTGFKTEAEITHPPVVTPEHGFDPDFQARVLSQLRTMSPEAQLREIEHYKADPAGTIGRPNLLGLTRLGKLDDISNRAQERVEKKRVAKESKWEHEQFQWAAKNLTVEVQKIHNDLLALPPDQRLQAIDDIRVGKGKYYNPRAIASLEEKGAFEPLRSQALRQIEAKLTAIHKEAVAAEKAKAAAEKAAQPKPLDKTRVAEVVKRVNGFGTPPKNGPPHRIAPQPGDTPETQANNDQPYREMYAKWAAENRKWHKPLVEQRDTTLIPPENLNAALKDAKEKLVADMRTYSDLAEKQGKIGTGRGQVTRAELLRHYVFGVYSSAQDPEKDILVQALSTLPVGKNPVFKDYYAQVRAEENAPPEPPKAPEPSQTETAPAPQTSQPVTAPAQEAVKAQPEPNAKPPKEQAGYPVPPESDEAGWWYAAQQYDRMLTNAQTPPSPEQAQAFVEASNRQYWDMTPQDRNAAWQSAMEYKFARQQHPGTLERIVRTIGGGVMDIPQNLMNMATGGLALSATSQKPTQTEKYGMAPPENFKERTADMVGGLVETIAELVSIGGMTDEVGALSKASSFARILKGAVDFGLQGAGHGENVLKSAAAGAAFGGGGELAQLFAPISKALVKYFVSPAVQSAMMAGMVKLEGGDTEQAVMMAAVPWVFAAIPLPHAQLAPKVAEIARAGNDAAKVEPIVKSIVQDVVEQQAAKVETVPKNAELEQKLNAIDQESARQKQEIQRQHEQAVSVLERSGAVTKQADVLGVATTKPVPKPQEPAPVVTEKATSEPAKVAEPVQTAPVSAKEAVAQSSPAPEPGASAPTAPAPEGKGGQALVKRVLTSEEEYQAIVQRRAQAGKRSGLQKARGDFGGTAVGSQDWKDLLGIGAYHFENGVRKFAEWSAAVLKEIPNLADATLKAAFAAIRNEGLRKGVVGLEPQNLNELKTYAKNIDRASTAGYSLGRKEGLLAGEVRGQQVGRKETAEAEAQGVQAARQAEAEQERQDDKVIAKLTQEHLKDTLAADEASSKAQGRAATVGYGLGVQQGQLIGEVHGQQVGRQEGTEAAQARLQEATNYAREKKLKGNDLGKAITAIKSSADMDRQALAEAKGIIDFIAQKVEHRDAFNAFKKAVGDIDTKHMPAEQKARFDAFMATVRLSKPTDFAETHFDKQGKPVYSARQQALQLLEVETKGDPDVLSTRDTDKMRDTLDPLRKPGREFTTKDLNTMTDLVTQVARQANERNLFHSSEGDMALKDKVDDMVVGIKENKGEKYSAAQDKRPVQAPYGTLAEVGKESVTLHNTLASLLGRDRAQSIIDGMRRAEIDIRRKFGPLQQKVADIIGKMLPDAKATGRASGGKDRSITTTHQLPSGVSIRLTDAELADVHYMSGDKDFTSAVAKQNGAGLHTKGGAVVKVTPDDIRALRNSAEQKFGKENLNALSQAIRDFWTAIDETHYRLTSEHLDQKADYAQLRRAVDESDKASVPGYLKGDQPSGTLGRYLGPRKPDFVKPRTGGTQDFEVGNLFVKATQYGHDAENYAKFADAREMAKVLQHPDFQRAAKDALGDRRADYLIDQTHAALRDFAGQAIGVKQDLQTGLVRRAMGGLIRGVITTPIKHVMLVIRTASYVQNLFLHPEEAVKVAHADVKAMVEQWKNEPFVQDRWRKGGVHGLMGTGGNDPAGLHEYLTGDKKMDWTGTSQLLRGTDHQSITRVAMPLIARDALVQAKVEGWSPEKAYQRGIENYAKFIGESETGRDIWDSPLAQQPHNATGINMGAYGLKSAPIKAMANAWRDTREAIKHPTAENVRQASLRNMSILVNQAAIFAGGQTATWGIGMAAAGLLTAFGVKDVKHPRLQLGSLSRWLWGMGKEGVGQIQFVGDVAQFLLAGTEAFDKGVPGPRWEPEGLGGWGAGATKEIIGAFVGIGTIGQDAVKDATEDLGAAEIQKQTLKLQRDIVNSAIHTARAAQYAGLPLAPVAKGATLYRDAALQTRTGAYAELRMAASDGDKPEMLNGVLALIKQGAEPARIMHSLDDQLEKSGVKDADRDRMIADLASAVTKQLYAKAATATNEKERNRAYGSARLMGVEAMKNRATERDAKEYAKKVKEMYTPTTE